jgi:hypothetical protein
MVRESIDHMEDAMTHSDVHAININLLSIVVHGPVYGTISEPMNK